MGLWKSFIADFRRWLGRVKSYTYFCNNSSIGCIAASCSSYPFKDISSPVDLRRSIRTLENYLLTYNVPKETYISCGQWSILFRMRSASFVHPFISKTLNIFKMYPVQEVLPLMLTWTTLLLIFSGYNGHSKDFKRSGGK